MSNLTTEQLIKDSTNLKDLELLLCESIAALLADIEGNLQCLIDEHLDQEREEINPEELSISLYHDLCYVIGLLEAVKNKAKELSANKSGYPSKE